MISFPRFFPFAFAALTALCATAQAATLVVDRTDDANLSTCSASANDCTLRGAILAANAGAGADTIVFAPGTTGVITLGGTALPDLSGEVNIEGPGANLLSVSGNNQSGIVRVASGAQALIGGLTLTAGNSAVSGSNTIGGAIDIVNGASVIAQGLWIKDNQAFGGGGIENFGTLTVRDSAFSGNSATSGAGGAIHSVGDSGGLTVSNSTFINNRAASSGGAIRSDVANTALDRLTVVSNRADSDGNGFGVGGGISAGGAAFGVRNSIVSSNIGGDVDNVTTANGFNFVGGRGVDAGLEVAGAFFAFKNNGGPTPTIAISQGGPAFNGGDPAFDASAVPFDQRGSGFLRVKAGRLDIGAFELQSERPSLVVTTTQDSSADDDMTSLREAITFANTNFDASTITFAPGLSGTITLQSALPVVNFATTINGPGANLLTIARADGSANFGLLTLDSNRPPFTAPPFEAAISGLTWSGGNTTFGGAIYAKKANLTINDCAFTGNTAFNGGAVYGALTVKNSTFSGNVSTHHGGAFYSLSAALLEQCTIDGNSATDVGGGVFGSGGLTVESCTIAGNSVNGNGNPSGGGIGAPSNQVLLRNSIVAGNTRGGVADDVSGIADSASAFNLIGGGTGASGISNGTNNNRVGTAGAPLDPLLESLQNNGGSTQTRALKPNSPALNAGQTDLTSDQRGTPRSQGAADDIGAFEAQAPANNPPKLNNESYSAANGTPFSQQLMATDADGDALTYALAGGTTLPTGLTLDANTGIISGTPTVDGRTDFSVTVSDGRGGTLTAKFIIIVSSAADALAPVTVRSAIAATLTRDALAATTVTGTITDIAQGAATPSGVRLLYFQLRRVSDGFAYDTPERGFTANTNRGYYAATLSAPSADTAAPRDFSRSLSFIPGADVVTPGAYQLVIAGQDNTGNWSVEVVPLTIVVTRNTQTPPTSAPFFSGRIS